MTGPLISVCVQVSPKVDRSAIELAVVGRHGKVRNRPHPSRFWAVTAMTLKQVQAIDGVKACTLSPKTW